MVALGLCCVSLWLALASLVLADTIQQYPIAPSNPDEPIKHRIAIVGAGAGGASTAYHLSKFHNETSDGEPIEIDIFESNSYVGGRTTTVNAFDDPRYPVELGASIFVTVNHILYDLTREFELPTKDQLQKSTGATYDLGIWDGSSFLFTIANDDSDDGSWSGRWKGYWDIAKLLWRYGLSPIRVQRATKSVVSKFLKMYDEYFPTTSLTDFAAEVGLSDYTGITGEAALLKHGVSEQFAREIVQSSTRVNYAQNLNGIHGLETFVCMAIEGAMAITGGNWQIFDTAIQKSQAKLHLNTTVTQVSKTAKGTYQIHTSSGDDDDDDDDDTDTTSSTTNPKHYDAIVLAAPYQFANITFTPSIAPDHTPEKIEYVNLHVTLFTTPDRPSPAYFGLASADQVPDTILTTLPSGPPPSNDNDSDSDADSAVGPTKFWSLSTLRVLNRATDSHSHTHDHTSHQAPHAKPSETRDEYLYKIFSPHALRAHDLAAIFDWPYTPPESDSDPLTHLPPSLLTWHTTKVWNSYPYLPPTTRFAPIILDSSSSSDPASMSRGIFYTSGIESFISTMETSALMGRNVARILVDGFDMPSH